MKSFKKSEKLQQNKESTKKKLNLILSEALSYFSEAFGFVSELGRSMRQQQVQKGFYMSHIANILDIHTSR